MNLDERAILQARVQKSRALAEGQGPLGRTLAHSLLEPWLVQVSRQP